MRGFGNNTGSRNWATATIGSRSDRYWDRNDRGLGATLSDWPRIYQDVDADELETGETRPGRTRRPPVGEWPSDVEWSDEVWEWIGSWLHAKEFPHASEQARKELEGTEGMTDAALRAHLRERRRRRQIRQQRAECRSAVRAWEPIGTCVLCEARVIPHETDHEPVWPDGVLMHRVCWIGEGSPRERKIAADGAARAAAREPYVFADTTADGAAREAAIAIHRQRMRDGGFLLLPEEVLGSYEEGI